MLEDFKKHRTQRPFEKLANILPDYLLIRPLHFLPKLPLMKLRAKNQTFSP